MSWEIWQSHTTMPGTAITADGLSDSSSKAIHTVRLVKTQDNPKFGPIFVWIIAKWLFFKWIKLLNQNKMRSICQGTMPFK